MLNHCFDATLTSGDASSELETLFDYLVRMSGDREGAQTVALESYRIITVAARRVDHLYGRKVLLYKTARSFLGDVKHQRRKHVFHLNQDVHTLTDMSNDPVQRLLGKYKEETLEFLLLRHRYGFSIEDISLIMGKRVPQTLKLMAQTQQHLDSVKASEGIELIRSANNFKMDIEDSDTNAIEEDLSLMKSRWISKPKWTFVLLLLLVVCVLAGSKIFY